MAFQKFQASYNVCLNIFEYYNMVGKEPRAQRHCLILGGIYAAWLLVITLLTVLRCMSLVYMLKSYRFLYRKLQDKARRKLHLKEKKKKLKRASKRELQKKIMEKRSELLLVQQRVMREAMEETKRRSLILEMTERSAIYGD